MKKLINLFLLCTIPLFLCVGYASATTYEFGDDYIYWPDYPSYSYNDIIDAARNNDDDVGNNPMLDGMKVYVEDGYLTKVEILFNDSSYNNPERITFDSLFINSDWDSALNNWENWDYYVKGDVGSFADYAVNDPYTYLYAIPWNYRQDHPVGFTQDSLLNAAFLSGLAYDTDSNILTYTFAQNALLINSGFAIGYTPYCANDVLLATASVPEPATMLLFGTGLIGLAAIGRKKIRKS